MKYLPWQADRLGAIKASGGEVRLDAPVERIVVVDGVATGVVVAGGERIDATRAVIANLNPRIVFGGLIKEPPSEPMKRLTKLRPGPGTMMIHFALSDLPAWSAGEELRRFA